MTNERLSTGASRRPPTSLLVASTVCYVWGVILVLSGISQALAAFVMFGPFSRSMILPAALFVIAIALLVAGRTIRRRRPIGFWLGAGLAVGTGLLQLFIQVPATPVWLGLALLLLILLALNRQELGIGSDGVGA